MLENTLAIILAGGVGSRLHPLTAERAKPAVPFGGKYRIIDFTLTNCLHSGIRQVLVMTQYKSHSLHKHLRDGWSVFNPELGEFITSVPPQMRTGDDWYSGTANAIYQNLYMLERSGAEQVLILSGDHIYRMDYAETLRFHHDNHADVTIACMRVPVEEASVFGVVSVDEAGCITEFKEKPERPATVKDDSQQSLVSMGIYVFSKTLLQDLLQRDHEDESSGHDFGRDILPAAIKTHRVFAYPFGGQAGRVSPDRYWRDVGDIDSYYEANMALLDPIPPLDLYQDDWTIRTYQGQYPPARTVPGESGTEGVFVNSILASGAIIAGGGVNHSILFPRARVGDEALIEDAILFSDVVVGKDARVRHCIIDKGVCVPDSEEIGYDSERDAQRFQQSPGGVIVIPKGYEFD